MKRFGHQIMDKEQLWQFSLAIYPINKELFLHWQDTYQLNVNLALFLLYLQTKQQSLSEEALLALRQQLGAFSAEVTQPLRALRRTLPSPWLSTEEQQGLRQQLLTTELAAERLEQQLLIQHYTRLRPEHEPLPFSELLGHYLVLLNAPIDTLEAEIFDLSQQAYACTG